MATSLNMDDVRANFAAAVCSAGLIVEGAPIMDGKLRRVPVQGDAKGRRSGSYVAHLDARPAGHIQNWKTGHKESWLSTVGTSSGFSPDDVRRRIASAALHRLELNHIAASSARGVIRRATLATTHAYLEGKQVGAFGLFLSRFGNLLMPLRTIDGKIVNLQEIKANGDKRFMRGGRVEAAFHCIGLMTGASVIVIAEGYATAATIYQATGITTIIACHSGNLLAVALAVRDEFANVHIIIAGDNDHHLPRKRDANGEILKNIGLVKAFEAAKAVSATAVLPVFHEDNPGTDWNDYAGQHSIAQMRVAFVEMAELKTETLDSIAV